MKRLALAFNLAAAATPSAACSSTHASSAPTSAGSGSQGSSGTSAGMTGDVFEAGSTERRESYLSQSDRTYFIAGTQHTWLTPLSFYGTTVSVVALPAWTNLVINQGTATHVDP